VVEDDPDGAEMMGMMLGSLGIEPFVVDSAENALSELETAPRGFDLVITDLALPEMDGIQMLHVMRGDVRLAHLKVVATTAYHTPELKVKLLDSGFDGYFPKPLETDRLTQVLERLLYH